MSETRVAVLLSAFNGEKYIEKQIESIQNQEGMDSLTIIIRNDGSTDNTICILNRMQSKYKNIRVIDGENKGLVASFFDLLFYAYNEGYDYYSFSDQDDYWLPEKLRIAIESLKGHEGPYMYAACSKIVDDNLVESRTSTQKKIRDITFYNSAIQNICPGHNQVLNHAMARMIVNKTKYSTAIYSQDMWVTKVASITGGIIFDNTPHTLYRQHTNNQLSFGKNKVEWVKNHIKRLMKDEGKKIAIQLKCFCDCYSDFFTEEQKEEIQLFFDSQSSFFKRVQYIVHTKMYRQRFFETRMFKMIYVIGGFNIG